jgi:FKBP-type peptidyl-prolyl cis-trans isomerase
VVDSLGVGIYPALSDSVKISYSAWLIPSMEKVDTSQNLTVLLSTAISGIQLCLPSFPVGSHGRIYTPSGLAFGAISHSTPAGYTIPANSNLLYKIKVISSVGTKLTSDVAAIDSYLGLIADSLISKQITVIDDASGIRYSVNTPGTGASPTLQDFVTVTYTGNLLGRDSLFANVATPTKLALKDQIAAWKIILPKLSEGAVITLYVPSGYGFGSASTTQIPAYSNLVYQLKLIKVN